MLLLRWLLLASIAGNVRSVNDDLLPKFNSTSGTWSLVCSSSTHEDVKEYVPCEGACVIKRTRDLRDKTDKIVRGCQKELVSGIMNKCHANDNKKSYIKEYIVGDKNEIPTHYVHKKCCFYTNCNDETFFEAPLTFLRYKFYYDFIAEKLIVNNWYGDALLRISMALLALVYSFFLMLVPLGRFIFVMKQEADMDDYAPTMDPDLYHDYAGTLSEVQHRVSGMLTIKQTSEVIARMTDQQSVTETTGEAKWNDIVIKRPIVVQAIGNGHRLVRAFRTTATSITSFLFQMIELGPYEFPFSPVDLFELFDEASELFLEDDNLLKIQGPVVVIGDLRGNYADLHRWLQLVGYPPSVKLLFLGNVLDQDAAGSIECLALIACLKIGFPKNVFMLRGATETLPFVPSRRFKKNIASAIGNTVKRFGANLPFAAIISSGIIAVPSGPSPMLKSQDDFAVLNRQRGLGELSLEKRHLIFNQPSSNVRMYRLRKQSRGAYFGEMAVQQFCRDMEVRMIIRGHNPIRNGHTTSFDNRLHSLWSAPSSHGVQTGAILLIDENCKITPVYMEAQTDLLPTSTSHTLINTTGTTTADTE